MPDSKLTHLDGDGAAKMVDVGGKVMSRRVARAEGVIRIQASTLAAIRDGQVPKGGVFATARIAGIMAAKRCADLIPLCHPLPVEAVTVDFAIPDSPGPSHPETYVGIIIRATASITAKTGIEMEALTAVAVAALTIYDMCKAIDKTMSIENVRLVDKTKTPIAG